MQEKLPIHEKLKVLEHYNMYKTEKWWCVVALTEAFGRKQISIYLWLKKDEKWSRKQKFVIRNRREWLQLKETIERLLLKL